MKVTVFGSGYVGLVTGVCLAEVGNDVVCVDVDQNKIDELVKGNIPIYEPGLDAMVKENQSAGRLHFTTDAKQAVEHGTFQFIAVGTPPDEDGSADLKYVLAVAETIATHMNDTKVIIDKSTVPVGTADKVTAKISSVLASRSSDLEFNVVSNPEFLKEGKALEDFMSPDRIVIGLESDSIKGTFINLYKPAFLICPDDTGKRKPSPDGLVLACKTTNTSPEEGIYIGDHSIDIIAGKAAGMKTVAAAYGYVPLEEDASDWKADYIVDSPIKILEIIS